MFFYHHMGRLKRGIVVSTITGTIGTGDHVIT
jgi:hypothetical protein